MPSSKDQNMGQPPRRRRSIFSTLFIPDLGASVSPLRETTTIFVNFVAMLFVLNGLFPRNHPALQPGSKVKLGLFDVIQTAWSNVTFTKSSLFQTMFFFLVVGCMIVTTFVFLAGISMLFVGRAHAAISIFTPPGGANDLAQQFIDYLFQAKTFTALDQNVGNGAFSPSGSGSSNFIQCSLYTALGYYSNAILIIAAMVLFYHLAWMTVETAHHGVVMGQRGNQIWAPIRLVFAIGLLVPIGSSAKGCTNGGAGLNAGQTLVIGIAEWGSGLASNVWSQFVTAIFNQPNLYSVPTTPALRKVVEDAVNMYACQYAYNCPIDSGKNGGAGYPCAPNTALDNYTLGTAKDIEICEPYGSVIGNTAPDCQNKAPWVTVAQTPPVAGATFPVRTTFRPAASSEYYFDTAGACGSYTIPAPPILENTSFISDQAQVAYEQNNITPNYNAHVTAFQDALQDAYDAVTHYTGPGDPANGPIMYYIKGSPLEGEQNVAPDIVTPIVTKYEETVNNEIFIAVSGNGDNSAAAITNAYTDSGWVSAGAWFNRIARVQTDLEAAASKGMPETSGPNIAQAIKNLSVNWIMNSSDDSSGYQDVSVALFQLDRWLDVMRANEGVAVVAGDSPAVQSQKLCDQTTFNSLVTDLNGKGASPTTVIFWLIDNAAGCGGVWRVVGPGGANSSNLLGVAFTGANPLADIAAFGQSNIKVALDLINFGITSTVAGSALTAAVTPGIKAGDQNGLNTALEGIGNFASGVGGVLLMVAGIFFTMGFAMAFYIPLLPFISFFFGTLTWVVAMLEAVIAMPLIALAHLNPEGAGLPGDMARGAYFMIFQIFLRPVLMIFGLLAGFLIFYIAISALNALFTIAVSSNGNLGDAQFTVSRIIYTIIYVLLAISAANHSFQLITRLPDTAMQWMGATGLQGANMGNPAELERDVAGIQAIATNQFMPQLGGLGRGFGIGVGNALAPGKTTVAKTSSGNITKAPS